ncbi:MAG: glycosyltransferase family 2 protein [Deltaproteobacteria bacterium]|nr:glycosyltransferase family 2 protein [Deltaproteobacteria bacterium]
MKLSVVIPCYNEARNIPLILDRFGEVVGDKEVESKDIEVVLVDNGSTDDTPEVLRDLLAGYPFARTVRVDVNQGYGFGILSGLQEANGEFLGWTHADMQTDPKDTIKALRLIESAPEPQRSFVKGNRKGRPVSDVFFTLGMGLFESLYLGVNLRDINAQPNLFHRSFFESWEDPPHDFSLDLYAFVLARKRGLDVIRFPVRFPKRIHGHSKWNVDWRSKWKFILRTLKYSAGLKRRLKG